MVQLTASKGKLFHREIELGKKSIWNDLCMQKEYYIVDFDYTLKGNERGVG